MKKYWISVAIVVTGFCLIGHADLIAHYRFDDSGNMTADGSGNGNTLIVPGGSTTPDYIAAGKFGGGSGFDGTQGWRAENIFPKGSFTFAVWLKPEGASTMIAMPWDFDNGFQVSIDSGKYRFTTRANGATDHVVSTKVPVNGVWQHLAMTYEVTGGAPVDGVYTGTIRGYIDGVLIVTATGQEYEYASAGDLGIGKRSTSIFNGVMDDVRIYDHALTQEEIQSVMTVPEPASR